MRGDDSGGGRKKRGGAVDLYLAKAEYKMQENRRKKGEEKEKHINLKARIAHCGWPQGGGWIMKKETSRQNNLSIISLDWEFER